MVPTTEGRGILNSMVGGVVFSEGFPHIPSFAATARLREGGDQDEAFILSADNMGWGAGWSHYFSSCVLEVGKFFL